MDYNDETKRLTGHPEAKELPATFESETRAVVRRRRKGKRKVAAAAASAGRAGDIKWGVIAAAGALALVAGVYFLSGVRNNPTPQREMTAFVDETYLVGADNNDAAAGNAANASAMTGNVMQTAQEPQSSTDRQLALIAGEADAVYLFPVDGSAIADNAALDAVAREAVRTNADVAVIAYTDESGNAAYNMALSERRAQSVAEYLAEHGVSPENIIVQGMGETHAFANDMQDRRAEVRLLSET